MQCRVWGSRKGGGGRSAGRHCRMSSSSAGQPIKAPGVLLFARGLMVKLLIGEAAQWVVRGVNFVALA